MPALSRRALLAAVPGAAGWALLRAASPTASSAAADGTGTVLAALTRASHPLRSTEAGGAMGDLRPLGAAVAERGAAVVGLGEVMHGAHELFTLKHRVFRYLVLEEGFTTFALETSWTSGRRLNEYVRHGTGDPRVVMAEEFGGGDWPWGVREYLDLIEWMRAHNLRHPEAPVHFMGNDMAHPSIPDTLFQEVIDYVVEHHPTLRAQIVELYRELRTYTTTAELGAQPQSQRQRLAGQARRAQRLLAAQRPRSERKAYDWTVQQARILAQTATLFAFDFEDPQQVATGKPGPRTLWRSRCGRVRPPRRSGSDRRSPSI